jgi:hypothetical protein
LIVIIGGVKGSKFAATLSPPSPITMMIVEDVAEPLRIVMPSAIAQESKQEPVFGIAVKEICIPDDTGRLIDWLEETVPEPLL